ncbi:4a-hydroxytetrahydrobiopterin dehydratase [bacterium]|nr:4a-hydroxytetrahydrobiopterin dehydratase [bacterium]
MALLKEKQCTSPEGSAPLSKDEENRLIHQIHEWELVRDDPHRIQRHFEFDGFEQAMLFVNQVADIAIDQNHHPDMCISYNQVEIRLSTHKIGSLHPNDFIMAAKIDALV